MRANVVQRVVSQQTDGPTIFGLHREKDNLRIRGTGRLENIGITPPGIHHDFVYSSKRIRGGCARFHVVAAVKNLGGFFSTPPAEARRLQVVQSPADTIGDTSNNKTLIVAEHFTRFDIARAAGADRGMRMRGRHQHVLSGYSGLLVEEVFSGVKDLT